MKKYFDGKGTITGWATILRVTLAYILYGIGAALIGAWFVDEQWKAIYFLPLVIPYVWFVVSTYKKRYQAFGFMGGFLTFMFPMFVNAPAKPENATVWVPGHWRTSRDGDKKNNLSTKK